MLTNRIGSVIHLQGPAKAFQLCLAVALAISIVLPMWARKQAPALAMEEVATTWVGLSADKHYLVRLVLDRDGSGRGGYVFLDEEPRLFRIAAWHYEAGRIDIEPVAPEGPPSWVGPLRGRLLGTTMHVQASGEDWKLEIVLLREAEMVERWERLRGAMQAEP